MKKASSRRRIGPSAASLAALPEVELRASAIRNPYATRMKREGIDVVHDGPSKASLAELPDAVLTPRARANPYAARLAMELGRVRVGRGRPRAGEEVGPTPARSVRLPVAIWEALESEAEATGLTVHGVSPVAYLHARLDTLKAPRRRR